MNNFSGYSKSLAYRILLSVSVLSSMITAATNAAQTDKRNKEVFTDEDEQVEKVAGKWILISSVDMNQSHDNSVPVVVTAIKTEYGQGKYLVRIKITNANVEIRGRKITQSIHFMLSNVMHDAPDTVLLEGLMPFVELRTEPAGAPLAIDIPHIYFNKLVKPILKNGELDGRLRLIVGIQEVRFADGTVWQRDRQAAFLKTTLSSTPYCFKAPVHQAGAFR